LKGRKVPYKRPLKKGHVEGYHQNSPGFLGASPPSQVPSVGSPDIGSLAHSDGFLPLYYNAIIIARKKEKIKKINKFSKSKNKK
jgi:hypothetical protein